MSEYNCTTRTNYFHVKDSAAFRSFMGRVQGSVDLITLWQEQDDDGRPVFGFGTHGAISGLKNAEADDDDAPDESACDEFICGLQEHVAEDDAVILLEAGHEKLRYVTGAATILTSDNYEHLDLAAMAEKKAAKLLVKPEWRTRCDY